MRCALIDGDVVLYSASFAGEYINYTIRREDYDIETASKKEANKHQQEEVYTEQEYKVASFETVKTIIRDTLQQVTDNTLCDYYVIYLSDDTTFRHDLFQDYKANRKGHKPFYHSSLREFLVTSFNAVIRKNLEADDCIITDHVASDDETIICSVDKDLYQISGLHYNLATKETTDVPDNLGSPDADYDYGFYLFCLQTMAGDSVDNYKGIPKVGYKRASKALEGCYGANTMWDSVVSSYVKNGLDYEYLFQQANLAYIRQYEEETAEEYIERMCSDYPDPESVELAA